MKCVSYNIQYGIGQDGVHDLKRVASDVAAADIIAFQEVDRYWKRTGMVDGPALLSEALPDHHWVYGANLDMDASDQSNGRIIHRRKQFGTMILSRWPILSTRNFPLPKWGDRQHHSIQQGVLEAVIETPLLGPIRVYSVHLSHLGPFTRLPQIARLKEIINAAQGEGGAWCGGHPDPNAGWIEEPEPPMPQNVILMGDFNCPPQSEEYAQLIGGLAPGFGRLTNRQGLVDAWVAAGHAEKDGETYPNSTVRIDYCLVSAALAGSVTSAWIDKEASGSDHWPVWTEFS